MVDNWSAFWGSYEHVREISKVRNSVFASEAQSKRADRLLLECLKDLQKSCNALIEEMEKKQM